MSKKMQSVITTAIKWLDRNAEVGSTIEPARKAAEAAEKSLADVINAKDAYLAALDTRDKAMTTLELAMNRSKMEKKLKAKESRLQAKLASLSGE